MDEIIRNLGPFIPKNVIEYVHLVLFEDNWKRNNINTKPPDDLNVVRRDIYIINRLMDVNCLNTDAIKRIGYVLTHSQAFGILSDLLKQLSKNPDTWNIVKESKVYNDVVNEICEIEKLNKVRNNIEKCNQFLNENKDEIINKIYWKFRREGFVDYTTLWGKDNYQLIRLLVKDGLDLMLNKQKEVFISRNLNIDDSNIMKNMELIKTINEKWGTGKCNIDAIFRKLGGKKRNIKRRNTKKQNTKKQNKRKRNTRKRNTRKQKTRKITSIQNP